MEQEIIKPVPGYEKFYSASSLGRVFSANYRGTGQFKELAQSSLVDKRRKSDTNYKRAKMWHINKGTPTAIHRVIAMTFVPNPLGLPQVNHIDGDKSNNRASNLEWCSVAHNVRHAQANGLARHQQGEEHGMHILTEAEVLEILEEIRRVPKYKGQGKHIADRYGVSLHCISDIRTGRSWRHLQCS